MDFSLSVQDLQSAKEFLDSTGKILNTPLVKFDSEVAGKEIYLKLENLQPSGSFKIRGAFNAINNLPKDQLRHGVYTTSTGNFGQGLARAARELQIKCTIIVPDTIPDLKLKKMQAEKAVVELVTYDKWYEIVLNRGDVNYEGTFIHPGAEKYVMAGNSTIGREILDQLPDVDTIICPYGSGGMTCGIGATLKNYKPGVKLLVSEADCAAPVYWSLQAGKASPAKDHKRIFNDSMGGKQMLPEMWPLVSKCVKGSILVTEEEIIDAVRVLVEKSHVVAEPSAAATLASALKEESGSGKIVCVISGGNLGISQVSEYLQKLCSAEQ